MNASLAALLAEHAADAAGRGAAARRAELLRLRAAGALASAEEQAAAAALLLHSDALGDVEAAQALALAAMARHASARALAATAYDRLRLLMGKPQKFGTQVAVREGRRELWPVDEHTTDSERAKWGLPPLAELRARVSAP